ncbi:MAG TPA: carbohydrate ABC transporter permease [Casimicrobiaceae bacterium]|jgi:ABC-type glycerol-3-phosphate transport system permease component|nr:carbohydrate ABC transporter permease [Casimicrobiaceae bacterium]
MASLAHPAAVPESPAADRWSRRVGRGAVHLVVILLCAITLFPMLWMLSTSFKIPTEVFTKDIQILPQTPTLSNFPDAFRYFPVANWFWSSLFIAVVTTAGKLAISIPAAFAFARLKFRGGNFCFAVVLGTMIVPAVVTYVPNYILVSRLEWINTSWGVIVPSLASCAFYIFLLRQYIRTLPQELLDAAKIDGATTWKTLWHIVLPNIRPAVAVVSILSFLHSWNQYTWPLLVLDDMKSKTLAVGMQVFASNSESAQLWGPMMATAALATLPPLLLYAIAQKQIISTFVTSGLKG